MDTDVKGRSAFGFLRVLSRPGEDVLFDLRGEPSVMLQHPPCRIHGRCRVWQEHRTRTSHESVARNRRGAASGDCWFCARPLVFTTAKIVLDCRIFHSADVDPACRAGLSGTHAGIVSALLLADDGSEGVRFDRADRHDGIDDAALPAAPDRKSTRL